jgi:predicted metal-dependent hydrolase
MTPDATHRIAHLAGGPISYLLRRTPRARGLRATIDPRLGLVVSLPPAHRRGWANPEPLVEAFLRDREAWLRRHLDRRRANLAVVAERGVPRDGGLLRFRGALHLLRIETGDASRTTIEHDPDPPADGAEGGTLRVRISAGDPRTPAAVLRDWCRSEARQAIEAAIEDHRSALAVTPRAISIRDPRTRWGSASRHGRLSFSWRLILAPPAALETVVVHELAHLRIFGHGPAFWALVASRRPDHAVWRRWLRDHALELHAALEDPARFLPFG